MGSLLKRPIVLPMLGLLTCAVLAVLVWPRRVSEPAYGGRALSAWLRRLPGSTNNFRGLTWEPLYRTITADELEAEDALRHMATNALPVLMHDIRLQGSDRSGFATAVSEWCQRTYTGVIARLSRTPAPFRPPYMNNTKSPVERVRWRAACGLNALGTIATSTVPDLEMILNDTSAKYQAQPDAAYALCTMGPDGVAALRRCLATNTPWGEWPQICAVWAVAQNPTGCQAALPELKACLHHKNGNVRLIANWALTELHPDPDYAAPVLASTLADTTWRNMTEQALNNYGMKNFSAASLVEYLDAPELHLRMAATNALRALYPETAAEMGIPGVAQ